MDPQIIFCLTRLCGSQRPFSKLNSELKALLDSVGKENSVRILTELYEAGAGTRFIDYETLAKEFREKLKKIIKNSLSPLTPPLKRSSPSYSYGDSSDEQLAKHPKSVMFSEIGTKTQRHLDFSCGSAVEDPASPLDFSYQLIILSVLEFRKLFLVLSYIGRQKLEDVISCEDADTILQMKDLSMKEFESRMWYMYGRTYKKSDRVQYTDWDSGKTYAYYCHVSGDGGYYFKGPHLNTTKTHLQRVLGDESVLVVRFEEGEKYIANRVALEGLMVGLWRYHFFVFKDESNAVKKKSRLEEKKNPTSVKCCFVRLESFSRATGHHLSGNAINELRCHFMHVHMVPSMAKYMARFSLVMSKTVKLPVDLGSVNIETIEDITCKDGKGLVIHGEDGQPLIHTDGTGFISEDLAAKCPKELYRASYIKDAHLQKVHELVEGFNGEVNNKGPPLLMQCRLFYNGCAVKGTLLVNKKLDPGTIQIRPSMVKVQKDPECKLETFNSLEIVAISQKPRRACLSKNLIALLSYGGVPKSFFIDLLKSALQETTSVLCKKREALKVAMNYGESDDNFTSARMIASGIPLNEPYLQLRLSQLANEEKKKFRGGKLPISESYYLMGTSDPTGILNSDEVCVIHEHGQINGKVLVYRNPCLHFGDIHVMTARYVKGIEDVVGNSKYGIFFSTKGQRSAATEMGNGDFDGDVYWVSKNPELLRTFKPSSPWTRIRPPPPADEKKKKKPEYYLADSLELELFRQFQEARSPSISMATAADSWLALMDQFLTLGDDHIVEKKDLHRKILHLIDVYYDALDAPKSGKKVTVPSHLKAEKYPHHMEKAGYISRYHSKSILGEIYDLPELWEPETPNITDITKLSCLDFVISETSMRKWAALYEDYKNDMTKALVNTDDETKNMIADEVMKKYRKILYEADDLEGSPRDLEDLFSEALAVYHVAYNCAKSRAELKKCGFAWKVAGSALCKFFSMKQNEKPIAIQPSLLRELL